jgi:hypothetical protein
VTLSGHGNIGPWGAWAGFGVATAALLLSVIIGRADEKRNDSGSRNRKMEIPLEAIFYIVGSILGWPLRAFRRWLDRQPHREPSQISTLHKIERLALGAAVTLAVLIPMGWLIFK